MVGLGLRDKGKAKASRSRTGDAPNQAKRRRGSAAAAAPPLDLEVAARSGGSVHTKEIMSFSVAHTLRSGRKVLVSTRNFSKPGPMRFRKGEKPLYDVSWKIPACVKVALEHYNRLNEDMHELVKAVDGYVFLYNGEWMHANFLAKSKQGTLKAFFAELKIEGMKKISCTMCTEMDPDDPKTAPIRGGCGACPSRIFHPAAGEHIGANPDVGCARAEYLGAAPGGACGELAWLFNVDDDEMNSVGKS